MVRTVAAVLLMIAGVCGAVASVLSSEHGAFVVPFVAVLFAGVAMVFDASDVLADHPDDELQRKRGDLMARWEPQHRAGGWQKPVRPPSSESRPGGLPPRQR